MPVSPPGRQGVRAARRAVLPNGQSEAIVTSQCLEAQPMEDETP